MTEASVKNIDTSSHLGTSMPLKEATTQSKVTEVGNALDTSIPLKDSVMAYLDGLKGRVDVLQVTKDMSKEAVLIRFKEATDILQVFDSKSGTKTGSVNWDELYSFSANIMDEYTQEIDQLLKELDTLYKDQFIWQEAASTVDSRRAASQIAQAEEWIVQKEANIQHMNLEFLESADIIKKTIQGLGSTK